MEGMDQYTAALSSKTPRGLTRFPGESKYISCYIFQKTGQICSVKEVDTRKQQLRDMIAANYTTDQTPDRPYKTTHPDTERSGSAFATLWDDDHPTVTFKAHSAFPTLSHSTVCYTGRVVNAVPPTTMALRVVDDGSDAIHQHSTRLARRYWDLLCEHEEPPHYTIVQELWPSDKSPTAGPPPMMTVNYHFTPTCPTSGPQGELFPLSIEPEMTSSYAKSSNEKPPLSPERDHSVIDHSFSIDQSLPGDALREKPMSIPVEDDPVIREPGIDDPPGRGADYDGWPKYFR
ncbi:hypothetical protein C2E23DRAFT_247427 [Lenzites betulinus]|nr:hypothetical protein C2E23DRAFT_247427 [Lenzites betulinus]